MGEERERRERHYQQAQIPQLRLLGFMVVLVLLALNRRFVCSDGPPLVWFVVAVLAYNLASVRALRWSGRHYRAVGLTFLTTDLIFFSLAVLYSGADRSWLFFLPLVRVADQTNTTFRRVIVFAHLATLGYLLVLLGAAHYEAHVIAWQVEWFKLGLVYSVGVYVALTARTAEGLRKQVAHAVKLSQESLARVREQAVQLDEARRAAEAASLSKSEFLANMSHEIRTPMTAIQGFSDLLLDADLSASDRLNHIQTIRRNSDHLLSIINDILDLSKIEAGKMIVENIVCSPSQIVVEVASLMRVRAIEKKIDFDVQFQTPIPQTIHSDPTRIRQILLNLVSNAIKFTSTGGVKVLVRCSDGLCPRLTLEVVDTGIGLSAAQMTRLFQPFMQANASTTRRYGGTGLGLAICQRMATMLGGELSVDSAAGRGSSFTFSIETGSIEGVHLVHDLREACAPALPGGAAADGIVGRILLAEDGLDNQRLISNHLRKAGAAVTTAENGRIAVERALAAEAAGEPFDLVLMDMQMPELDGYGATAKLRSKGYRRPIIALTAHAMAGDRERCLTAGCDDYLTKPIDRQKLVSTVAKHIGARVKEISVEPLVSSYADDPDMKEIVVMFVEELPGRVRAMREAHERGDRNKLSQLAHQLKGAAGGYGFDCITEAAGHLEDALVKETEFSAPLAEVFSLCDRVRPISVEIPLRRSA